MTTKQIAESVGKTERCVQGWAKKTGEKISSIGEKISSVQKLGKPADYDLSETVAIIETGLGKNAAAIYRQNAEQNRATSFAPVAGSLLTEKDLALISSLTAGIVSRVMENLSSRVESIEGVVSQRRALLPAPTVKPRDNINRLVRDYATKNKIDFRAAWADLYRDFGYRTNSSPTICAKNRGMAILDYIEAEGMIDLLEAVALDIYGGAA